MANPDRGEIDVTIGGETHTLRFDFTTWRNLDAEFSSSHGSLAMAIQHGAVFDVGMQSIRYGLKHLYPKLTPQKVERWLNDEGIKAPALCSEVTQGVGELLNRSIEKKDEDEEEEIEGKPEEGSDSE